jgi:hypothetical protein
VLVSPFSPPPCERTRSCLTGPRGCSLGAVTIRWFSDADRAEQERIARQRLERDVLLFTFADWLAARAGHSGPVRVPELTPEMEAHLIGLLRTTGGIHPL